MIKYVNWFNTQKGKETVGIFNWSITIALRCQKKKFILFYMKFWQFAMACDLGLILLLPVHEMNIGYKKH